MVEVGIPVIDIAYLWHTPSSCEYQKTVKSIAQACRDCGFFYIKNHGVSDQLREDVFKVMEDFFALPLDQKNSIKSAGTDGFQGYFKFQSETTAHLKDDEPDWREGFYASVDLPDEHPSKKMFPSVAQNNQWPEKPSEFRDTAQEYQNELNQLGFKIMSALALGLGLKDDYFDGYFKPYPSNTLGMYHYLPYKGVAGADEMSCGEHTDYGVLTILMQDDEGGLEMKHEEGQWIPAPPIPGTFVINLGDMLEVWTKGAYKATEHRVRKAPKGRERQSVAFFFDPSLDCVIEPIDIENPLLTFKERKPNSSIAIPVTFGEYLAGKYRGTFPQSGQRAQEQ